MLEGRRPNFSPNLSYAMVYWQVVKVVAERAYGQDEEVMISYGLKSSAECLEDHGTVPDIDMDEGDSHDAFMVCMA